VYRRFLRPGWIFGHLLVVLAVLLCLRLGWWQWGRTHDADGTVQNFGYALLWPVFGGAFVYMWIRFLQLELLKDGEDEAELTDMAAGAGSAIQPEQAAAPHRTSDGDDGTGKPAADPHPSAVDPHRSEDLGVPVTDPAANDALQIRHRPPSRGYTVAVSTVGNEEQDNDPELAAYNRALAALAEKDRRRAR